MVLIFKGFDFVSKGNEVILRFCLKTLRLQPRRNTVILRNSVLLLIKGTEIDENT